MSEPVLRGESIVKRFRDGDVETEVLRGIDIEITSGEFVALMGPSGSGKSTLLSILGTLLRASGGTVDIASRDVSSLSERELTRFRNHHLGFVFQFHHLLPEFTAIENVMFPSFPDQGRETPSARARALDLLDRVGLSHRVSYLPSKLSGGQRQRVAVARALMMTPDLVLADEPTGNLDRETGFEILELFREVGQQESTAFLISTHDPEIARRCDRTVSLVDGRVVH